VVVGWLQGPPHRNLPNLITHVKTTLAPATDWDATPLIHTALARSTLFADRAPSQSGPRGCRSAGDQPTRPRGGSYRSSLTRSGLAATREDRIRERVLDHRLGVRPGDLPRRTCERQLEPFGGQPAYRCDQDLVLCKRLSPVSESGQVHPFIRCATAAALNCLRLGDWLADRPCAGTRSSLFARLLAVPS
jgi:hypothetical protein